MKRILCLALVLLLALPVCGEAAPQPKLNKTNKTLYLGGDSGGEFGEEFDFNVLNRIAGSTYKWSVSNSSVGTVNSKNGLFTAKNVGTVTVTCKITLKNRKTKTLKATVKVKANAESITITNAPENNTLYLGETFRFTSTMTSASGGKATDSKLFSVSDPSVGTITPSGTFTATGLGTTQVIVKTYQTKTYRFQGQFTATSQPVTVNVVMSPKMQEEELAKVFEETFNVLIPRGEDGEQQAADVYLDDALTVTGENAKKMPFSATPDEDGQGPLIITVRRFSAFPEGVNVEEGSDPDRLRNTAQCVTIIEVENIGDEDEDFLLTVGGRRHAAKISAHSKFVIIDIGKNADEFELYKAYLTLQTDEHRLAFLNMLTEEQYKALRLTFGGDIGEELLSQVQDKEYSEQRGVLAMNLEGTTTIDGKQVGGQDGGTVSVTRIYGQPEETPSGETPPADVFLGAVTISGTAKYKEALTVSVSNANNTGALTYQWLRNGAAISGATSTQYTCGVDDIGQAISCNVTSDTPSGTLASGSVVVGKADGPAAPEYSMFLPAPSQEPALYNTTSAMEYSSSKDFSSSTRCSDGVTQNVPEGTYYIRFAETTTHLPSLPCSQPVTVEKPWD